MTEAGDSRNGVRIDKWLWAVRLFKTRSLAAAACRSGHVEIGDVKVKPSRDVRIGDIVRARTGEITRTTRVIGLVEKRIGATAAKAFAEDLTPAAEYSRPKERSLVPPPLVRPRGSGRPTKKERRALDPFLSSDEL